MYFPCFSCIGTYIKVDLTRRFRKFEAPQERLYAQQMGAVQLICLLNPAVAGRPENKVFI